MTTPKQPRDDAPGDGRDGRCEPGRIPCPYDMCKDGQIPNGIWGGMKYVPVPCWRCKGTGTVPAPEATR